MRVLLNALNCTAIGPRVVMENLIPAMSEVAPDITWEALLPRGYGYESWSPLPNLRIHWAERSGVREWTRLQDLFIHVPRWCKELQADVCFTLGEIGPISPGVPHVVLLHRAYLCKSVRSMEFPLNWRARLGLAYMRWHLSRMAGAGARFIVQTPVMKDAFLGAYSLPPDRVFAILQAVPRTVMNLASREIRPDAEIIRASDGQLKLLFMAGYYPHKNHSVIIPVLRELRKRGMDRRVHFFLTLSPEGDHRSREFMEALTPYQDQVTNLGVLSPDRIPGVYAAADALFLPTFLESLGLPYLEALATGTPILTSDRDFARWICEDLALYFEPKDPASIATAIGRLIENPEVSGYPARAGERLKAFPRDWKVVAQEYVGLLLKTVAAQPSKSGS